MSVCWRPVRAFASVSLLLCWKRHFLATNVIALHSAALLLFAKLLLNNAVRILHTPQEYARVP